MRELSYWFLVRKSSLLYIVSGEITHLPSPPSKLPEITDKCLQYSKDYDCRFYDCLNQRFPCGESSRKGKARAHCVKSKERAHKLTDVGKIWINNIIKCFVKEMTEVYKRPSLDCTKGNAMVMGIQQRCYTSNDFCNVGWEHRKELWNIFNEPITSSKSHFYKM
uniref:Uncharacterized protein n=1 Tax=Octopus bimaculoides TaxID=37653 RepID=A0A0L8GL32_OCTBM